MMIALALCLLQDVEVFALEFKVQEGKPQLRCKLKAKEGVLLGVDILKAGVSRWADDRGTSLGLKDAKAFYGDASVMTESFGADLGVTVSSKLKAADGAASMSFEGELPVRVGLELQEGEAKEVELTPGSTFAVGPYTFKVKKAEKLRDSLDFKIQDIQRVTFAFDAPRQLTGFDVLKIFKFFDADGKERKSAQRNFQGSFQGGGEHLLTVAILPTERPVSVKWAVYGRIESVLVPLKHEGAISR